MEKYVSEEFERFTLIYEENVFGGILNWGFFGFWAWFHVRVLRRGGTQCAFGGI
jgi:hypothetical protein